MKTARRQQINQFAELVRKACELTTPVDLKAIEGAVSKLGGSIKTVETNEFEAKIEKTDDGAHFNITLASSHCDARRKFSGAHELGHLFLHMGYLVDDARWNETASYTDGVRFRYGRSVEEYEAHEFAAALLMPRSEFESMVEQHTRNNEVDIDIIANHFGVSTEAATTRGRWLNLFPWE